MANRKRNIQMKFWVTEEEKRLIDEKMSQLPTKRYGAYLRKMAIDGYIIQVDTTDIREMTKALGSIGRNTLLPSSSGFITPRTVEKVPFSRGFSNFLDSIVCPPVPSGSGQKL